MQESDYASLLKRIEGNVQALRKSDDLDEDDWASLKTYHEEFVKMCGVARDAQGPFSWRKLDMRKPLD